MNNRFNTSFGKIGIPLSKDSFNLALIRVNLVNRRKKIIETILRNSFGYI